MNSENHKHGFKALANLILYYFQGLYPLDMVDGQLGILLKSKEYCKHYAGIDLMYFLDELISQDETANLDECTSSIAAREIGYSGGMRERSTFVKKAIIILKKLDKLIPSLDVIVANKLLHWVSTTTLQDLHENTTSNLINQMVGRIISTRTPGDDYFPIYIFAVAYICSRDANFIAKSEIDAKNKSILEVNLPHAYERLISLSRSSRKNFLEFDLGM